MKSFFKQIGFLYSLPVLFVLFATFAAPLLVVIAYSFMPPKTFDFNHLPTLENFKYIISGSYYLSYMWSFFFAALTVIILLVICYPLAYAMAKIFGKWSNALTLLIVIPIFVSENIRLFGWLLFFIKGGVLLGFLKTYFGIEMESIMYTAPAILLGTVYVYLPFMLFPLVLGISMIPDDLRSAASDLGASKFQIFKEVDIPLAMPGIVIGCLLTFVLSVGALAESKILGGQTIILIADDIETAFTYGQNWPRGSSISVLLMGTIGLLVIYFLNKLNLDKIMGRR